MRGCWVSSMSIQPNLSIVVPGRGVRQDHFVAFAKSVHDLDGVHRALAERHIDPLRGLTVREEAEEGHRRSRLAIGGPTYVEHVLEPLHLDRPLHPQIRASPATKLKNQLHVHGDGSVL